MNSLEDAQVVSPELFDSISGESAEAVFEYRFHMPFQVKEHTPDHKEDDDVVVYGPVYVGDDKMLDRHKELVDAEAIMASWQSYSQNPVILYNHRKDYGVIGVMEEVEMGEYEKPDGSKIAAVFGRARIDGGEKNITRKINKGMLRAFSIGFLAKAAVKEGLGKEAYIKFTDIEWIETSVVDIPASPNALFDVSKSLVSYDGAKHIQNVEETDASYIIEFGKAEMPEDESPSERDFDADLILDLMGAIDELRDQVRELSGADTVKTPVSNPIDMSTEESELVELSEEVEETFTVEVPVELNEAPEIVKEETLEEEAVEETEEELLEEEAVEEEAVEEEAEEELPEEEEVAEEELPEEVVEESAVEAEVDMTSEVLSEVAKGLSAVEGTLATLLARLDETEALKSALAEATANIEALTAEKSAAEAEAAVEAEVGKRLAERVAEAGLAPTEAKPKSLSPSMPTDILVKTGTTKHDPAPDVSHGMAHLGAWLEGRLGGRRLE
jgi:hypothetical protein